MAGIEEDGVQTETEFQGILTTLTNPIVPDKGLTLSQVELQHFCMMQTSSNTITVAHMQPYSGKPNPH